MFSSPNTKTLDEKLLTTNQPIVKENMGWLYGDVYFIKLAPDLEDVPKEQNAQSPMHVMTFEKAKELIDILDSQPKGRKAIQVGNFFLSGNFMMARTDPNAIHHYHLHMRSLYRPLAYMQHIINEMNNAFQQNQTGNAQQILRKITCDAIAKGMFNLKDIPESFNTALTLLYELLNSSVSNLAASVKLRLATSFKIAKAGLYLSPNCMNIKKTYHDNIKTFLQDQAGIILTELQDFAKGDVPYNLLTLTVIEMIKEDNESFRDHPEQLKQYLKDCDIHTVLHYLAAPELIALPGAVIATENLTILFMNTLTVLQQDSTIREKLQTAVKNLVGDLTFDHEHFDKIKAIFDKDERDNGYLHRFYLECLRREDIRKTADHLRLETVTMRYTEGAISYGDDTIPAHSHIVFLPAIPRFDERLYKNADAFDPDRYRNDNGQHLNQYPLTIFVEARRRCPAHGVTPYIVKMFISHLLLHYDFSLQKNNAEDQWPSILNIKPKVTNELADEKKPLLTVT